MRTIFDHEAARKGICQIVDLGPVDTIVILPTGSHICLQQGEMNAVGSFQISEF